MNALTRSIGALTLMASALCAAAFAQTQGSTGSFPQRPVTLIVPFPAGAATDGAARLLATHLTRELGQSVVVENVAGAAGALGVQRAMRSAPDGYTLHFGTINDMLMVPLTNRNVGYKTTDLMPIGMTFVTTAMLVGNPAVTADTFDELVAQLRQSPNSLNLGHPGVGTVQHLTAVRIAQMAGIAWTYIPYKGAAPLNTDLLGGHVDLAVVSMPSALPNISDKRVKSFGVIRTERDPDHPEFPSVNESKAVKGLDADQWIGVFAPQRTPPDVQRRLVAAVQASIAHPEFRAAQLKMGASTPKTTDPASFAAAIAASDAVYRPLAEKLDLQ